MMEGAAPQGGTAGGPNTGVGIGAFPAIEAVFISGFTSNRVFDLCPITKDFRSIGFRRAEFSLHD
jgi:hypothetical protein